LMHKNYHQIKIYGKIFYNKKKLIYIAKDLKLYKEVDTHIKSKKILQK
jgi:hypothetical protein